MTRIRLAILALALVASGCGGDPVLMNLAANTDGPDEFAILPTRPLELPPDYDTLPPPTPGGVNRTDPTPERDAILALGGDPSRAAPASTALVAHAGRFGLDPTIRQTLAAEDLDYRRRNDGRLLERVFQVNVYHRAYEPLSLDQYRELERLRRAGVRTPSAPPQP